ncbi:MAG: hypothetical protein HYU36_08685 [Planctomycetes bacterium]|nr:hypothetical protein [Planctomycetota bacterium]
MAREEIKLERPNAWLSEIQRVAALLERVYAHTSGEIWLFDNDLKFLEARPRPNRMGAFEVLYNQRIDGSLATRVRCVKILLRREIFDEFCDQAKRPQLFKNLCTLRPDRLDTFYVGCLEEVNPPEELAGHDPWIFYLGKGHLQSQNGIAIVRPHVYPFTDQKDKPGDIAVAWSTSDPELKTVLARLSGKWFSRVFVDEYTTHFKSVTSIRDTTGKKVVNYRLDKARGEDDLNDLWWKLQAKSSPPVLAPVDCAIVTALPEEYKAARRVLRLVDAADGESATGRLALDGQDITIVATQCRKTGGVHAAAWTARMIERWRPKCVVLLGRCAGAPRKGQASSAVKHKRLDDDRQEGDVIVANEVCAYEYAALLNVRGAIITEHDVRWVSTSPDLLAVARTLIREGWCYEGKLPKGWGRRRRPKALDGVVASGSKLLRAGGPWFTNLKKAVGKRQILAGEMEAEGVGVAVQTYGPLRYLFIKGISDFGDRKKTDAYNDFASSTAARFLKDLMTHSDFLALLLRIEKDAAAV